MRTSREIELLIDSILHMIVNFGEQNNYPEAIINDFAKLLLLTREDKDIVIKVLETRLALEAYTGSEAYLEGAKEDYEESVYHKKPKVEILNEMVKEWVDLLDRVLSTKITMKVKDLSFDTWTAIEGKFTFEYE